ncbi:type 1 glutamine amidotransferase [Profundibacterium mesophilum]|uniref:GMP synthase n=1 Tax=Profundibacterium mesophilum KAUST100406-0324 TaxID=1037889 RepID=A0A921NQK3_9RHOB|nr:type 1 glutamine amidotransferase [Profundibacterium mesophilum]KAF0677001.1 GMP synthase [Profundibacterium mesophilum KAUST100406-0324]
MLIGILQTGHAPRSVTEKSGDYPAMFERLLEGHGFSFCTFPVCDGVFPDGPEAADAWLITGSRHGVYEAHSWIPPLEALIRRIHASDMPLVGICFGHQIIAQALGGKVEKFAGGWSVGRRAYDWQGQSVFLNAWHQDQVVRPPDGARTLASGAICAHAALACGPHTLTIQPHPEFDDTVTGTLIETRGPGVVPAPLLDAASADLGHALDRALLAERIADVLKGHPADAPLPRASSLQHGPGPAMRPVDA